MQSIPAGGLAKNATECQSCIDPSKATHPFLLASTNKPRITFTNDQLSSGSKKNGAGPACILVTFMPLTESPSQNMVATI